MGQQQLFLIILVSIIVAISTVIAINRFESSSDNANLEAVRSDISTVITEARTYFAMPPALGGGGNNFTGISFTNIALHADSLSSDRLVAYNVNGTYSLSSIPDGLLLTSVPAADPDNELRVEIYQSDVRWLDSE
jgi:hypothetical protein